MPASTLEEKEIKSAVEAVTAVRERIEAVESKTEKIESFEAKFAALEGVDKEVVSKANIRLDQFEEKNQALAIELESVKKSDLESQERFSTIEKQLILKSTESPKNWKDSPEYKAFNDVILGMGTKQNFSMEMMPAEQKSYLRTDVGTQGGFTVPTILDTQALKTLTEITPIFNLVRIRALPGVKNLDIPIRNGIPTAYWVGEAEQVATSQSAYNLASLTAHALGVVTETTRDLLNFSQLNMLSEISVDANEEFSREIGNVLLLGNGVKKPQGILDPTSNVQTVDSIGSGVLSMDDMIQLLGELKTGYNPVYGFNRKTLVTLRSQKDSNGNYLWRIGGESMPNTIIDLPYIIMQDMPDIAIGATPVILGDFFRGYTVLDAMGMEVVRDDVTQADKRKVKFCWFRFLDGKTTIPEAFKLINIKS